jgi:hypothetical protein
VNRSKTWWAPDAPAAAGSAGGAAGGQPGTKPADASLPSAADIKAFETAVGTAFGCQVRGNRLAGGGCSKAVYAGQHLGYLLSASRGGHRHGTSGALTKGSAHAIQFDKMLLPAHLAYVCRWWLQPALLQPLPRA